MQNKLNEMEYKKYKGYLQMNNEQLKGKKVNSNLSKDEITSFLVTLGIRTTLLGSMIRYNPDHSDGNLRLLGKTYRKMLFLNALHKKIVLKERTGKKDEKVGQHSDK